MICAQRANNIFCTRITASSSIEPMTYRQPPPLMMAATSMPVSVCRTLRSATFSSLVISPFTSFFIASGSAYAAASTCCMFAPFGN
ncbi:hypothetical protein D1872_256740 [compost metagenome]